MENENKVRFNTWKIAITIKMKAWQIVIYVRPQATRIQQLTTQTIMPVQYNV
jgi:hypothetical protein